MGSRSPAPIALGPASTASWVGRRRLRGALARLVEALPAAACNGIDIGLLPDVELRGLLVVVGPVLVGSPQGLRWRMICRGVHVGS